MAQPKSSPLLSLVLAAFLALAALLLEGCGEDSEQQQAVKVHYGEPPATHATAAPKENRQYGWDNASSSNGTVTLPPSQIYVCPSLHFQGPNGAIDIEGSRSGESPIVHCPNDYEYKGPRIACSWVDRVCMVFKGQGAEDVTPDLCQNQYNLTFKGVGLTSWPDGVVPVLVFPPSSGGTETSDGKAELPARKLRDASRSTTAGRMLNVNRNTSGLPRVVTVDDLRCAPEDYIDLDFEKAKVKHSYPPYSAEHPWNVLYEGIADFKGKPVDLKVTRVDSVEAPGNAFFNGNSSSTGRINVNSTFPSQLRFQFVESKTTQPVSLGKVYFTIFDVEDSFHGARSKEVNISGFVEYFVANDTRLHVIDRGDGMYGFSVPDDIERLTMDTDAGVKEMWQKSLRRSLVLSFRDVSEFTLNVRAVPVAAGQIFEFAGYSEMVKIGTKIKATAHRPTLFQQKFSAAEGVALRDNRQLAHPVAARTRRWNWVATATIGLGLVAVSGLVVLLARLWGTATLRIADRRLVSVASPDEPNILHRNHLSPGPQTNLPSSRAVE